jgi:hypothetical protein
MNEFFLMNELLKPFVCQTVHFQKPMTETTSQTWHDAIRSRNNKHILHKTFYDGNFLALTILQQKLVTENDANFLDLFILTLHGILNYLHVRIELKYFSPSKRRTVVTLIGSPIDTQDSQTDPGDYSSKSA